jgi:hypothetical protein
MSQYSRRASRHEAGVYDDAVTSGDFLTFTADFTASIVSIGCRIMAFSADDR